MKIQWMASLGFDSFAQQFQERFGGWPCISTNKNNNRSLIDCESSFNKELFEVSSSFFEIFLIDKIFDFGLELFFKHVSSEIGNFNSVVLSFVVAG